MTKEEEYKNALNAYMNLDVHINKTLRLIGISAIKKQIPKKPFRDKDNSNFWTCPYCKEEMYWDTDYGQQKFKYCNQCGQALDWSDSHE